MVYTLAISGSEQGPRDDKNPERWQAAMYNPYIALGMFHLQLDFDAVLPHLLIGGFGFKDLGGSTYNSLAVSTALIYLPFRFWIKWMIFFGKRLKNIHLAGASSQGSSNLLQRLKSTGGYSDTTARDRVVSEISFFNHGRNGTILHFNHLTSI